MYYAFFVPAIWFVFIYLFFLLFIYFYFIFYFTRILSIILALFFLSHRYEQARWDFEAAIRLDRTLAPVHVNIGVLDLKENLIELYINFILNIFHCFHISNDNVFVSFPFFWYPYLELLYKTHFLPIVELWNLFLFLRSLKRFNIAIRMDPTYVRAYLCRAEAYERSGHVS